MRAKLKALKVRLLAFAIEGENVRKRQLLEHQNAANVALWRTENTN